MPNEFPVVEVINREELKQGLAEGSVLLLDVREPTEFAAGHIPGARLFPLSTFEPANLPAADGKRIVFSCRSGARTLKALAMAQAGGRTDVTTHYQGSMLDWVAAGELVEA